jgi:hypothetical protein
MSGNIPPLPNMPSWRGAQLKQRDTFTFVFTFTFKIMTFIAQMVKYDNQTRTTE